LVNNFVRALDIDNNGVLWCGTLGGVSSFDGATWTTFTEKDGLARNYVISCAVDNNNVKWFGTYESGVSSFDGRIWKTYTSDDGLADNVVNAIAFDGSGKTWFGTYDGVSVFDGSTWEKYTEDNCGISSSVVFSIAIDENDVLWFGTYAGVSSFDGNSWTVYSARTINNVLEERCIYSIDIEKNGLKWFGTTTGIWNYDGETWKSFTGKDSGLKNDVYVRALLTDEDGKKWIGASQALSSFTRESLPIMKKSALPVQMTITGNYPNPFNPTTSIEYIILDGGYVKLDVYNLAGQKVRSLFSGNVTPGKHVEVWNGKDDTGLPVASGIYLFRLKMEKTDMTHRMMLVR
ncbi:two-component regulator propeller domain-containing protein, partial [Candidatus Omnitrophota bacterium]